MNEFWGKALWDGISSKTEEGGKIPKKKKKGRKEISWPFRDGRGGKKALGGGEVDRTVPSTRENKINGGLEKKFK